MRGWVLVGSMLLLRLLKKAKCSFAAGLLAAFL